MNDKKDDAQDEYEKLPTLEQDHSNEVKNISPEKTSLVKETVNILLSVLVAYILFILIRTFLFFPFQVVGDSMKPTLLNGDRLILNRLAYIDRFDVVVFPAPDEEVSDEDELDSKQHEEYVKRIIGLPGDEIRYKQDSLYINGEMVHEKYLEPIKEMNNSIQVTPDFSLEDIPNSESRVVPEDMYLVLGDNRIISKDSRSFGFVPMDEIEGSASLRIWPLNRIGFLEGNE